MKERPQLHFSSVVFKDVLKMYLKTCLNRKLLNINYLFIELLYKNNITQSAN